MKRNEKEVIAPKSEKEEIEEIRDVDIGLTKKDVDDTKAKVKEEVSKKHVLTEEQEDLFQQILSAAEMPVKISDTDFKLGKNELDVRFLNRDNKYQMIFRELALLNVNLKLCSTSLIDLIRLVMVIADHLGVEDIIKSTDDIIEKIDKANKIKEQLKREKRVEKIKEEASEKTKQN